MSVRAINAAFDLGPIHTFRDDGSDGGVSVAAKFLAVTLADYSDDVGRCWPKQETLARRTSMGERSIRETLALLERRGLIRRVERRRDDGSRRTDIIHLLFLQPALTAGSVDDAPEPQDIDEATGTHRRLINRHSPPEQPAATAGQEPPLEPSLSLSLERVRELAGDALASMAVCPGIASLHPLRGLMTGEAACSLEDVEAGVEQAAAWFRGKQGPGSMRSYDLARRLAAENRDRRLAGAPDPKEIRHDQPSNGPAAKRVARDERNARSFAVASAVAARRSSGAGA